MVVVVCVFYHFHLFCDSQILGQICCVEVCDFDMAVQNFQTSIMEFWSCCVSSFSVILS